MKLRHHHCNCNSFSSAHPDSLVGTLAACISLWLPEGGPCFTLKWSSLAVLQVISTPPWRESNITKPFACFLSSPWRRRKLSAVEHSTLHLGMMEEKERRGEGNVVGGLHSQLHCVRGSRCTICVVAGEMTTLLACRMTCLLGTSVIDARPTEIGKTLTDSDTRTS